MRTHRITATLLSLAVLGACTDAGSLPFRGRWGLPVDPGLSLHPVSGAELRHSIETADARVVVVNVWATWCTSCREEFPALLRLRRDYRARGVAVVLVSGDFPSERDAVLEFLRGVEVDFPTYIKSGKDMDLIAALHPDWSGALPVTFIYDGKGNLLDWWQGAASYDAFAAAVDAVLAQQRAVTPGPTR